MYKSLTSIACFIALAFFTTTGTAQKQTFAATQIKEDLDFLKSELTKKHPNLYLYSRPEVFDSFFAELYQHIPDSMTELEVYRLITPVSSIIKDGHTLFFPSDRTVEYYYQNGLYFPFKIYWDGKTLFVAMSFCYTQDIPDGAEIISINGVEAAGIMKYCLSRMMRDGENETYPVGVLNNWFNEYYSYFFGHPDTFNIRYRLGDGAIQGKTINALNRKDIAINRDKRYPERQFGRVKNHGITLEFMDESKTAILTIKDFHKAILKQSYGQKFPQTIKRYFSQISEKGVEHLVLDMRDNQGGEMGYGVLLLSYLLDEPFSIVEEYFKVGDPAADPQNRNIKCKGPSMGTFKPKSNVFRGKLSVLVNSGSFSNTSIVSSALRHYKKGVFIGEETGGNPNIICGSVQNKTLPNTKIKVEIPTLRFVLRDKENNTGKGLIPEHLIRPSIQDIIHNRDVVKAYATGLVPK